MKKGKREKDRGGKHRELRPGDISSQFAIQNLPFKIHFILHISSFILPFLLYAPTLFHPAMYDTLLHTQLADDLNLWTVWLPNERFGFYRPLVFLPLVLMQALTGGYSPLLMHIINVMMHLINVALLISLVRRVWKNARLAVVAGLLFASFPFAYQALAIYGNNPYLAVSLLILLGLHAIVGQTKRRQNGRPAQHWRLLLIFTLALLTHEMGILLLPLGLFLGWVYYLLERGRATSQKDEGERIKDKKRETNLPNRSDPPLTIQKINSSTINYSPPSLPSTLYPLLQNHSAFIILSLLYLVLYTFLPRGAGPLLDYGGNAFGPKLLLLLQTLTYPLVPLFDLILPGPAAIWVATALFFISSFIVHHSSFLSYFSFSSLWFLLFASLVALTLPTYYIEDGARLLYPMGIGVALLWATIFNFQFSIFNFQFPARPLLVASHWLLVTLLLATVIHSAWFTRRMVGLYDKIATSVWGISEIAINQEADAHVYVNFPQWVTWPEEIYPQGNEFAPLLGDHLFMSELLRVNFGIEPEIINLHVPERLANTPYAYGIYGVSAVPELDLEQYADKKIAIYTQTYREDGPKTAYSGQLRPISGNGNGQLASIGDLLLHRAKACTEGNSVKLEMWLSNAQQIGLNQTFFVQALNREGALVGQADGPLIGLPPGRLLLPNRIEIVDQRRFTVSEQPNAVLFGLYDFTNGERAAAIDSEGNRLPDDALRLDLTLCS